MTNQRHLTNQPIWVDAWWQRPGQPRWPAEVTDPGGTPREVVVTVDGGQVVVSAPPGEGFSMTPDQADFLTIALQAASRAAVRSVRRT